MTYSELVNLIKESHDSWSVSEGMEHLPESEQEKDFLLEGLEPVAEFDDETLMGMLQDEFPEYGGNWIVSEMNDGTIDVEYNSEATSMGLYLAFQARSQCDPNHQAWIAAGKPDGWDYQAIELPEDFNEQFSMTYDKMWNEYLLKRKQKAVTR